MTAYLALASFPAAGWLALNPVRFSWGLHHGFEPMPVEVRDRAESADRYVYFLIDALTIGFVAALMKWNNISLARVGFRSTTWERDVIIGILAGGLLVVLQFAIDRRLPNMPQLKTTDRFERGPVMFWVLVAFVGAPAEELWIAFCLVVMIATGHSAIVSVVITAAVFGAVHFPYGLGGATAVAVKGAMSALLFLWWGALIPMALFHFVGSLGSLYLIRRATLK